MNWVRGGGPERLRLAVKREVHMDEQDRRRIVVIKIIEFHLFVLV